MSVTPPLGLPTGPKGKWGPTLRLIRNPREAMEAWVKEFGDPFLLNALNGPVVVTGREELIRTIYGQSPDAYEPFAVATTAPLMGAGSMFVLDGEEHRWRIPAGRRWPKAGIVASGDSVGALANTVRGGDARVSPRPRGCRLPTRR